MELKTNRPEDLAMAIQNGFENLTDKRDFHTVLTLKL